MIGFCSTCIDPFTTCDACDGTGKVAAKESTKELRAELPHCGECMGWGRVWYRDRKGIEWDEQCDSCEGTGYLGTTEQEDQLIEALNWHRGTLRVSSANKMAELASMIDRGQVAELAVAA
jgi:DnaJ-class molecular chaperone